MFKIRTNMCMHDLICPTAAAIDNIYIAGLVNQPWPCGAAGNTPGGCNGNMEDFVLYTNLSMNFC